MDEIDVATERAESFTTAAIRMALSQSAAGPSTGVCQACDADIEAARLKANPHARHCCSCAAELEAMGRRARRCGPR